MKISILCTDPKHPVMHSLKSWVKDITSKGHDVMLVFDKMNLQGGDILFLVSCSQIILEEDRKKFKKTLVLHASDLPKGRGWSPYIWSILAGKNQITVSLLEAKDPVDTGAIWQKTKFDLEGHELLPEIYEKLFAKIVMLMTWAIEEFESVEPKEQTGDPGPYLRRRSPEDSRLNPYKTIAEQFNLLRVVDSERFPAFFDFLGKRYLVKIEKDKNG